MHVHGGGHHVGSAAAPRRALAEPPCTGCPTPPPTAEGLDRASAAAARTAAVRRVFWITMGLNFVVAAGKGIYSYLSGSVTLGADAFHSVLDGSANVLALLGMHLTARPADLRHPYGRAKFEILGAVAIGALIAFGLFEMAGAAVEALRGRRPPPDVGAAGFAVVLASMVVNFFVARYEARRGRELGSPLLTADAHHTQSDLYASGAVLLSFIGATVGLSWADGATGLVLVVMVGQVAWSVMRENVPTLLDTAVLDPDRVREIGAAVPGVASIHRVRSRGTKWAVELDLHMQVAGEMTVEEAHRLAHQVEDELRVHLPSLSDVVVHIEPGAGPPAAGPPPTPLADQAKSSKT